MPVIVSHFPVLPFLQTEYSQITTNATGCSVDSNFCSTYLRANSNSPPTIQKKKIVMWAEQITTISNRGSRPGYKKIKA